MHPHNPSLSRSRFFFCALEAFENITLETQGLNNIRFEPLSRPCLCCRLVSQSWPIFERRGLTTLIRNHPVLILVGCCGCVLDVDVVLSYDFMYVISLCGDRARSVIILLLKDLCCIGSLASRAPLPPPQAAAQLTTPQAAARKTAPHPPRKIIGSTLAQGALRKTAQWQ